MGGALRRDIAPGNRRSSLRKRKQLQRNLLADWLFLRTAIAHRGTTRLHAASKDGPGLVVRGSKGQIPLWVIFGRVKPKPSPVTSATLPKAEGISGH